MTSSQVSTKKLLVVSLLSLYLELLLIRWIGTEIRIFAYLQNTVLVVCFLGMGIGCMESGKKANITQILLPLGILSALLAIPASRSVLRGISQLLSSLSDFVVFSPWLTDKPLDVISNVSIGLAFTFALMILILEMFIPIGRLIGRLLSGHPRIIFAYSVNVAASLLGVWIFVALGAFSIPPWGWFSILGVLLLCVIFWWSEKKGRDFGLLALIVLASFGASFEPNAIETKWSPYQKLVLTPSSKERDEYGVYTVRVNNASYQEMLDLSKAASNFGQYDVPYQMHPAPKSVLIVGAGSGNDVAAALRHGVEKVTAVDIDPVIADIGKRFHPEKPYDSPKVKLVIDDARSVFATTQEHYDMVVFALLDSHASTAMTNARLDHFVYTRESITRAKELLNPGGVIALSFFSTRPFITDRFERTLREVFGTVPVAFEVPSSDLGRGATLFISGDMQTVQNQLNAKPELQAQISKWQEQNPLGLTGTTPVPTDDWPYIYLKSRSVPILFYLLAILLGMLVVYRNSREPIVGMLRGWGREQWHFFFLGAAFLLLEVQNISKAAIVLGSTWQVNAVIITGVLIMVLLANLIALKLPKLPLNLVYLTLFLICLGLYFIDLSSFAFLPYTQKSLIVGTLTTLPMLFSGIIFIRSFAASKAKDSMLGANLIGSLVGGVMQTVTFVVGIKALLIIVAALYGLAWISNMTGSDKITR